MATPDLIDFIETSIMVAGGAVDEYRLKRAPDLSEAELHLDSALAAIHELTNRSTTS